MDFIRWGIIGCGAVTERKSGPAFYQNKHSTLYAVTRRNFAKAKDYARRHGVPKVYDNTDELINDSDIDAIYIATPPSSHLPLALKVAEAGKPCCVEKPMALNYQQCLEMIAAFREIDQPLFVAYYRRSLPRFIQIKKWLDQHEIGNVRNLSWNFCKPASDWDLNQVPNWRTQPEIAGAGYFMDLACHGLDLFQFLLGDIVEANGLSCNQQQLYEAEDAVSGCWRFASGIMGSGSWNFAAHKRQDQVQIMGESGEIRFSVFNHCSLVLENKMGKQSVEIPNPDPIQQYHVHNMNEHLRGNYQHPSLADSASLTNWVMDKILGKN